MPESRAFHCWTGLCWMHFKVGGRKKLAWTCIWSLQHREPCQTEYFSALQKSLCQHQHTYNTDRIESLSMPVCNFLPFFCKFVFIAMHWIANAISFFQSKRRFLVFFFHSLFYHFPRIRFDLRVVWFYCLFSFRLSVWSEQCSNATFLWDKFT